MGIEEFFAAARAFGVDLTLDDLEERQREHQEALADWQRRFDGWSATGRLLEPVRPEDEFEPYNPRFTTGTVADAKRFFRRRQTGSGGPG